MRAALVFGVVYWAVVFAIAFALGVVRTMFVAPHVGALGAVVIELPFMLAASYAVARMLLARHRLSLGQRVVAGILAFVLLMTVEAGLAATLAGLTVAEWASSLAELPGILGLAGQLCFAAMPALLAKVR